MGYLVQAVARLLLLSLLLVSTAHAAGQGLLWHISGKGADSYLFGTMHSDDERVTQIPVMVERKLAAADTLMLELSLDGQTETQVARAMMLPAGRSLSALVGDELATQAQQAMGARGIPAEATERLQPWAVVVALSMPPQGNGQFLDKLLYQRALESGKQFQALESVDEQLAVFKDFSLGEQKAMLRHVLAEYEGYPRLFEQMTEAYLAGDLTHLAQLSDSSPLSGDVDLQQKLMEQLLVQRNRRMLERMMPLLSGGKVFVAVGALHLEGEKGLVSLLRQQGYTVVSLY